jgi:hypothetical protein
MLWRSSSPRDLNSQWSWSNIYRINRDILKDSGLARVVDLDLAITGDGDVVPANCANGPADSPERVLSRISSVLNKSNKAFSVRVTAAYARCILQASFKLSEDS